jgi:PPOX class probable F420-dependent enzyme
VTPRDIDWSQVVARLVEPRNYWLTSIARDGAPHAAPVWGVVVADVLYLYSERHTVKAKNLIRDPRVALHLESGDDVVIVHGRLDDRGDPAASPDVVAALDAKYRDPGDAEYLPSADDAFDVLYALVPTRALMWQMRDYDESQRRWAAP